MEYLYDSKLNTAIASRGKELAIEKGIEIIDTAEWSEEKKRAFYYSRLMPISVRKHRKLKGRVRTHKAGYIHYSGVLVTDDDFFHGEEAITKLNEI